MSFLERNAPIILLIEDDEYDRVTLTRMLKEHGYGVISANGKAAVDTFAINHQRVALVLASTGLSDVERIKLDQALYRIDPFVPVVIAARRASHRPNSGEDSGRSTAFATLIGEVQRLLHNEAARAAAQAQSFARVQAPLPGSGSGAAPAPPRSVSQSTPDAELAPDADVTANRHGVFFPDLPDVEPLRWTGSSHITAISTLDPRSYLTQLSHTRRARWKRVRRVGLLVAAAGCAPLVVPLLLEMLPMMQTRIARAVALDEPVTRKAQVTPPLASASISARMGIVPLVSSAHVTRSNFAGDLGTTLRAAPKTPSKRTGKAEADSERSERSGRSRRARQR
jgi:CheY-like chemotaxis protein